MSEQPWEVGDDSWNGDTVVEGSIAPTLSVVEGDTGTSVDLTTPMTSDEARELTEAIKSTSEVLYVLIARAHAGRAYEALGYSTFADYVREEFDMSRSRAYQMLDQAKVIAAIESAAPDGAEMPKITEAAARDLKSIIGEVVPEIQARTADLPANEAGQVVEEIVEDYRDQVRERREDAALEREEAEADAAERRGFSEGGYGDGPYPAPAPAAPVYDDADDDFDPALIRRNVQAAYDLYSTMSALQSMPDQESVINTIPVERRVQINEAINTSVDWLIGFRDKWLAQPWQSSAEQDGDFDGDFDGDADFDGDFDGDFDEDA